MSTREPAVSVLIAVYNGERYLREAIESVLAQTRGDFELLIVDDGSTDDTPAILAEYARLDPRVVVHRVSHAGRTAALNLGCRAARAELIARLDADDPALPGRLERQLRFLEANEDVALLGGGVLLIDEHGEIFGEDRLPTGDAEIRKMLQKISLFYHSNVTFRRSAVEAVGGYRTVFKLAEDYDLWLRISERYALANLPELVGKYRSSPQQESVGLIEAQAMSTVAARASARDRREGRLDRLDTVDRIDAGVLAAIGVDEAELTEAVIRHAAWYAEHLSRAGQERGAAPLWEMALSRCRSPSTRPELRNEIQRRARLRRKAASYLA